jgi:hypothetical protein
VASIPANCRSVAVMGPWYVSAEYETEGHDIRSKGDVSRGALLKCEGQGTSNWPMYGVWPAWQQMQWPDSLKTR